jgi:hypothetical protein
MRSLQGRAKLFHEMVNFSHKRRRRAHVVFLWNDEQHLCAFIRPQLAVFGPGVRVDKIARAQAAAQRDD